MAANLTASNLGADLYLVGEFLPWDSPHQDASTTLRRDGEIVEFDDSGYRHFT